jgi:hypothetical protein
MTDGLLEALRKKVTTSWTYVWGDRDGNDVEAALDEHESLYAYTRTLEEECEDLRQRVVELEGTLEAIHDIGAEKTSKEEKIAKLVSFARNRGGDQVVLTAETVQGVTGVSQRYAYDLIDELPQQYEWFVDRSDASQYGDLQINTESQDRALIVDIEQLQRDPEALNKFNNADGEKGGVE